MKQIILSPLILTLLGLAAIVYVAIGFQLINKNSKLSLIFERFFIHVWLLGINNVAVGPLPFNKLNPTALHLHNTTLPAIVMQFGVYGICLIFLISRLNQNRYTIISIYYFLLKYIPSFCLYLFIISISFAWSGTPAYTLKSALVLVTTTVCFIYVGQRYSMKSLFNIVLLHQTLLLILSFVYQSEAGGGWSGVLSHKNPFSFAMALSTILLYIQSVRLPQYKIIFGFLSALGAFCVFIKANSGMGKVVLIVLFTLLGFLRFIKRLPPRVAFACMGLFLAIGISLVILITHNAEYLIVEKLGKDMTLTGRTLFWPIIVNIINRQPLLGYGYDGFWQPWRGEDDPASPIVLPNGFVPQHSHNGYLDIGLESGWLGLSLFIITLMINVYYGVLHLTQSKDPAAVMPLVIFTWIVLINVTENGINDLSVSWVFLVLMTTRLTMEMAENNSRKYSEAQDYLNLESKMQ
ncbi:O-antigen ligase family protein [Coleofasciculus sp. G2-EDA-02]|uniref:O-antigen ligase family protein n=1 Tax=Coleofasciculus sp. G2-EDA-02 TaxID=3069529 RepID=UPI0032F43B45